MIMCVICRNEKENKAVPSRRHHAYQRYDVNKVNIISYEVRIFKHDGVNSNNIIPYKVE